MKLSQIAQLGLAKITRAGFFHVFGSNVINKLVAFLANILIVRFMTKDDYGLFSYANSIYSMFALFTGLGMISAILIYCAEKRPDDEKARYYRYGLTRGLAVDALLVLVMFAASLLVVFPLEDAGFFIGLLIDYVFQFETICLRSKKENKRFAYLQVTYSLFYGSLSCIGAFLGGIIGVIVGRYLAYVASVIVGVLLLKGLGLGIKDAGQLKREEASGMWRYSIENGAASIMGQIVYLINVVIVGQVLIDASSVAAYRVATMLPEGFLFIPSSILVFTGPYFIEHNDDMRWFRKNAVLLFAATEAMMVVLAAVLIIFAEPIIVLLWGEIYLDSVPAFRVMAASLLITPLRTVCVNLLACLRMTRENLIITALALVANVLAVFVLTNMYGIVGASWAVLGVISFAAVFSAVLLERRTRYTGDSASV